MNICAITMVYRDHWALSQWYDHYARHLGAGNLFVVAHGADRALPALCPGANILTVPRDRLDGFDRLRDRVLNGFQAGLGAVYDWVIRTDADELICLDPELYSSFSDLLGAQARDVVFALGLNVVERPDDPPLDKGAPALSTRSGAVFSGLYSKAWAVRKGLPLLRHGVGLRRKVLETYPLTLPPGVYLAHLKYANRAALRRSNRHRREVANSGGKGLPGAAWQKPLLAERKFYARFEELSEQPWDACAADALARVTAEPVRDPGKGVLRAQNIQFDARTTLPGRIRRF